jgi:hypothetical protein
MAADLTPLESFYLRIGTGPSPLSQIEIREIMRNGLIRKLSGRSGLWRAREEDTVTTTPSPAPECIVLAHLAGKLRRNRIRVLAGDRVNMELSPFIGQLVKVWQGSAVTAAPMPIKSACRLESNLPPGGLPLKYPAWVVNSRPSRGNRVFGGNYVAVRRSLTQTDTRPV